MLEHSKEHTVKVISRVSTLIKPIQIVFISCCIVERINDPALLVDHTETTHVVHFEKTKRKKYEKGKRADRLQGHRYLI
jgi:hypothetical protein